MERRIYLIEDKDGSYYVDTEGDYTSDDILDVLFETIIFISKQQYIEEGVSDEIDLSDIKFNNLLKYRRGNENEQ